MAAVTPKPSPSGDGAAKVPDIASIQSQQLLKKFVAAKPAADSFVPNVGMADGGDVQLRPGLYTPSLIGPDDWPTASESEMARSADQLGAMARQHARANEEAKGHSDQVLQSYWTSGDGATAAAAHYEQEYNAQNHLVDVLTAGSSGMRRLSDAVGAAKRLIRQEHDQAHDEIEAYLKSPGSLGIAGVAPIVAEHRTLIQGYSADLKGIVADETQSLTNKFGAPEAPPKENGGRGDDTATGSSDPKGHSKPEAGDRSSPTSNGSGGNSMNGSPGSPSRADVTATPAPSPAATPSPSRPSMPSLPSPPSGGSGASPLSGAASGGMGGPMSSLLGGGPAGLANNVGNPASSVQAQTSRAMQTAMGGEFGCGLMAGANAAGAVPPPPPPSQPVPQAPASPLAAPMSTASPAAAPATVSTPTPSAAPAVAAPAGGAPMGSPAVGGPGGSQMTSYGSVLPPGAAAGGAGPVAGGPAGLSGGAVPPGPVGGGGAPGASGFVPVDRGGRDSGAVSREISRSDLETARAVVADLAAASSVVHPGLDWAVGVARGGQGIPRLWIATNEGLGYIPAGVYVPRSMPVVRDLEDGRWIGWFNPAETVVRAIKARGEAVSAVATTFMSRSEMVDETVRDVSVGVTAVVGGPEQAEASQQLQSRAHRLETVAPALFHELSVGDRAVVDAYARHLTQQAVFSSAGPELSAAAQGVARAVLSGSWPSTEEWSTLRDECSSARLMAGSQRPGVIGIEDPQQSMAYQYDFVACQRLETLVCWERDSRADVVYAARAAGVPTPSLALIKT